MKSEAVKLELEAVDIAIIFIYLFSTAIIGIILSKRAQKSKSSYLLGGKKLPWYLLGVSNASGMFDISGTMWLVTLAFIYGLKSIWIPWLWPVFNQVFLMVFLSAWLRRSNVTTGAEWIKTRFGKGIGSSLSHNIVVVFALISCLGFLAYGFVGLGKFIEIFIPWEIVSKYVPFNVSPEIVPHLYGIVFTAFAIFYTVVGGMISIVWADVVQYFIMTVSSLVIGIIAMNKLAVSQLNVPDGWLSPFFGLKMNIDWSGIINEVNDKILSDGYSLFSLFFGMMLFKGILVSAAGPAPNYDMQKILATKSPKEAAKMSGFVSVILNPVRYFMITGFAVLAIIFYNKLDLIVAGKLDFEQILPSAINEFAPPAILGLLLAGLLAAFNGTFAGTLNAAQAYIINDIYLKYINPKAKSNQIKIVNYSAGLIVVAISVIFGFFAKDVNSILQWIVSGLWGGYIAANILKWYWWRFSGKGYFWGMLSGIIMALLPGMFGFIFNMNVKLSIIDKSKFVHNEYIEYIKGYSDDSEAINALQKTSNTVRIVKYIDETAKIPGNTRLVKYATDIQSIPELIVLIHERKEQSLMYRIYSFHPLYFFPVILVISVIVCVVVSLKTKPADNKALMNFYRKVRPWGFWKPIHDKVVEENPGFKKNKNFWMDMFNIFYGTICQTALVALPIFIITRQGIALLITIGIILFTGVILKYTWWDRLEE